MPDGSLSGDPGRVVGLHESNAAPCPRCGRWFRVTVGDGAVVASCMYRVKGRTCGQHAAILSLASGYAIVIPVSPEEAEEMKGEKSGVILRRLNLVGAILTSAA